MNTAEAREIAIKFLDCSPCKIQMAAVIWNDNGIISTGWNHANGNGGIHAERDAIDRAEKAKLSGARLTVAGRRKKNGKWVLSRPCELKERYHHPSCLELALACGINTVEHITKSGDWITMRLQFVRVK